MIPPHPLGVPVFIVFIVLILSTIASYKEKNLDFSPRLLTDNLNYILKLIVSKYDISFIIKILFIFQFFLFSIIEIAFSNLNY